MGGARNVAPERPSRGRDVHRTGFETEDVVRLQGSYSPAAYAAGRSMAFFIGQNGLVGQRLDVERGAFIGDPVRITNNLAIIGTSAFFAGAFSVSDDGVVAYRSGMGGPRQLTWFDRSGNLVGTLGFSDEEALSSPAISPDGHRVAID